MLATRTNGVICVNTLTPAQEALSSLFAGMTDVPDEKRFDGWKWDTMTTGSPALEDAVAAFDCRITQVIEVGTHDVFICEVDSVRTGPVHEGLIYYARGYHKVAGPT